MRLRVIGGDGRTLEREPPRPGTRDYAVGPDAVRQVLEWYGGWERLDRPGQKAPDGWHLFDETRRDGRVVRRLVDVNEGVIEVSFVDDGADGRDFQARAYPVEEAYALALEADERSRARGITVYNERHPRP
jgi:hypothetical protein